MSRSAPARLRTTVPGLEPPAHGLRLVPAPVSDPPYDDEAGRPALTLVPARPPLAPARPRLRVTPGPGTGSTGPTVTVADLPDVRLFAQALVHRMLEVVGGVRPVPQLQRDTTPGLYGELERALARRPRPAGPRPSGRDVRSVHVQPGPDGTAEVCATVRRPGGRMGALAMHLQGVDGRWLCTQVQGL